MLILGMLHYEPFMNPISKTSRAVTPPDLPLSFDDFPKLQPAIP